MLTTRICWSILCASASVPLRAAASAIRRKRSRAVGALRMNMRPLAPLSWASVRSKSRRFSFEPNAWNTRSLGTFGLIPLSPPIFGRLFNEACPSLQTVNQNVFGIARVLVNAPDWRTPLLPVFMKRAMMLR